MLSSIEKDVAAGHLVVGMAGHDLGERAFAGAVLAHDGMHFALRNFKAHAFQDFAVADVGAEVLDLRDS